MAERSIVVAKKYHRFENTLFMMGHDDFRFNNDNYKPLSKIVSYGEKITAENGHRATVVTCENGKQYLVFSDWSAKEASND